MQYFCKNKQGNHTLVELFAKVPFHYSLSSDEEELVTYMAYKELATDHERVRRITASQHDELISILEKRLPRGSRIEADYVAHKSRDDESPKTWEVAMMRIIAVVTAAREAIHMSRSYGNPDIVYSFPSTAVPSPRSTKKRASTLAIRDVDTPSGSSNLAVRSSLDVPLVAAVRVCRSCGNPAHILNECPVLYYSDTNNDHGCNWSDSFVSKASLAQGEVMWQERLILPGCEIRERYHPAGSPLYLMCNSKKLEGNQGGGKGPTQTRGTKTKVSETVEIKTKVTKTKVVVTRTTKTATKETPALGVTKVMVKGTRGRIPEGVNTTRPKGITT